MELLDMSPPSDSQRVIAIHQPNFLPWLGFFHKVAKADCFVFLDDVEFSKGSVTNRVRIILGGNPYWLTIPISDAKNASKISELKVAPTDWRSKHLRVLREAYSKAPYLDEILPILEDIYSLVEDNLARFNFAAVERICTHLNLTASFRTSSELAAEGKGESKLVAIVKELGGSVYFSGNGAKNYQSGELFSDNEISLSYSSFREHPYSQSAKGFMPGMSILDALFNLSAPEVMALINRPTEEEKNDDDSPSLTGVVR